MNHASYCSELYYSLGLKLNIILVQKQAIVSTNIIYWRLLIIKMTTISMKLIIEYSYNNSYLYTMIVIQEVMPAHPFALAMLYQTLQGGHMGFQEDPRNGSSFQLGFEPPFLSPCQTLLLLLVGIVSESACHVDGCK